LACPFCGSGAEQLVVERWSEEEDPDASYHVECLKCGANGPQGCDAARCGAAMERAIGVACMPVDLEDTSDAVHRDISVV
jgi:hypothetical protein